MDKILVVDDDIDLLDMVKLFLQRKNFMVSAICKWEEIEASIKTFNPALILLDISLKGADGRVICKQLKTTPETKDIPVLIFSGNYNVRPTLSEFLADGFIEKPFDPANLVNEINLILYPGAISTGNIP